MPSVEYASAPLVYTREVQEFENPAMVLATNTQTARSEIHEVTV